MTELDAASLKHVPDAAELSAALERYFTPAFTAEQVEALRERLLALLADDPRRRGQVSLFDPRNGVGFGELWREEGAYGRTIPSPLDHAILLAATSPGLPRARPYLPAELVGTWRLEARADGKPVEAPPPTWELRADGSVEATGYLAGATRWCVHRTRFQEQLWLTIPPQPGHLSLLLAVRKPDRFAVVPPTAQGTRDRFVRA